MLLLALLDTNIYISVTNTFSSNVLNIQSVLLCGQPARVQSKPHSDQLTVRWASICHGTIDLCLGVPCYIPLGVNELLSTYGNGVMQHKCEM